MVFLLVICKLYMYTVSHKKWHQFCVCKMLLNFFSYAVNKCLRQILSRMFLPKISQVG